jgi:hypothetical protein
MARKTAVTHPCVFATDFVREQVDPRIKAEWIARGYKPKWGDLRTLWRERHCGAINPYDSRDCPYPETECAIAFLQVASRAAALAATNPHGLFASFAKTSGIERADHKPLARHRLDAPAPVSAGARPPERVAERRHGPAVSALEDVGEGEPLHRRLADPIRLGDLLGALDPRPREGRADDGSEGA